MATLLTRDEFRNICLERDKHECRVCGEVHDLSVHHILERKLWEDGGYYEHNGVTLCPKCHLLAEGCFIMPHELWSLLGYEVDDDVYPEGFELNIDYDKWGQEVVYFGKDKSFIVIPNEFEEKFCKATRLAGGMIREVNPEWLAEYMSIEAKCKALYIGMGVKLPIKNDGLY